MKRIKYLCLAPVKNRVPLISCAVVFFVFFSYAASQNSAWTITDNDTVNLYDPFRDIEYHVSGAIFKAIDPRYISNRHGILIYLNDSVEISNKTFTLLIEGKERDIVPAGNNYEVPPTVGGLWNYRINEELMFWYRRVLPCKLMPHAIEKIEYFTAEQCRDTTGSVHITTRNIERGISSNKSTLYLLDDTVITEKIFEAIDPVYIQSLQRITDRKKISAYGKKAIKEVVYIKTFKIEDVYYKANAISIDFGDDSRWGYEVDGIQLKRDAFCALKSSFFKTWNNTRAIQEKYPGKSRTVIVTL